MASTNNDNFITDSEKTITLANLKKLSDELIADTEKSADKISAAISKKFVAAIKEKISVLQQET